MVHKRPAEIIEQFIFNRKKIHALDSFLIVSPSHSKPNS